MGWSWLKYSNGLPRLINNLCDNVLLSAFSDDARQIDAERVHAVINELTSSDHDPVPTATRGPEDVDQAVEEITQRYVRSLEVQVSEGEFDGPRRAEEGVGETGSLVGEDQRVPKRRAPPQVLPGESEGQFPKVEAHRTLPRMEHGEALLAETEGEVQRVPPELEW